MNRRNFLKSGLLWVPAFPAIVKAQSLDGPSAGVFNNNPAASGAVQLLSQDFESGVNSPPSGWNATGGSPVWNQTPAIRGSFSVGCNLATNDSAESLHWGGARNFVSSFFAVSFGSISPASSAAFLTMRDATDTNGCFTIELRQTTNNLQLSDSTGNHAFTLLAGAAASTIYFIWVDYTTGTGVNAICTGYISTTTTKPGSAAGNWSNGNSVGQADHCRFSAPVGIATFDYVRVSTATIGSNPV